MAKLKVHAGDFKKGGASAGGGAFTLWSDESNWRPQTIRFAELQELEVASEDSVKRLGGTLGWGVAGAALLGPVGLLAGLLAGGRGKKVTFVARFTGGQRLLATTDAKTFTKMQAAVFSKQR